MSSISNDADKAYIEYHFDKPITSIEYYISLWGSDELFMSDTNFKIEIFVEGEWELEESYNINAISTNKNELDMMRLELSPCARAIRFFIEDKKNSSVWNGGRVVLGDIQFTQVL